MSYVKTGQAISQIAIDIASFIKKHIFVQAVRNYNMEMVKIIAVHKSWASLLRSLIVLVLKNSGITSATRNSLEKILIEMANVTTDKAIKNIPTNIACEGGKAAAVQMSKRVAEVVAKKGGKSTAVQAVAKEVVKKEGMDTVVQAAMSAGKEVAKKG